MAAAKLKKGGNDGEWVTLEDEGTNLPPTGGKGKKKKKVFRVLTVRGRQEREWLDSGLWQPLQETVIPAEAKAISGSLGADAERAGDRDDDRVVL